MFLCALAVSICGVGVAPAAEAITAGKYSGKWEGSSGAAGGFTMSLAQSSGGWKADVSFTMGGEEVKCTVTALSVEGAKVRVVYTFDLLGMKLESTIDGERLGSKLAGKYRTRAVADSTPVDQGTWEAAAAS